MKTTALLTMLAATPALAGGNGVLTYHNQNSRHGLYTMPGLTTAGAAKVHEDPAFTTNFTGNVYAQPLYYKPTTGPALLIVATESNQILGLDPNTGATIWHNQLAASVPLSSLPCGNINPEGVTGAPTIDPASGNLYFDALTATANGPRHYVYALSATTGQTLPGWPVDVQAALAAQNIAFDSLVQGERGGVMFFKNNVYVEYGGRAGDCGNYRGVSVQIRPSSPPAVTGFWSTVARGGGIWAQGGSAADATDLFVTTGNTFATNGVFQDGNAVFRLKPGLVHSTSTRDYFAPSDWYNLDNHDLDLGGTEALPLNVPIAGGATVGRVIAMGKDGNAYLMDRTNLGGVGGQIQTQLVSNSEIITGPAVYNTATATLVAFGSMAGLTCSGNNVSMLSIAGSGSAPISTKWCANYNGRGSPIITTTDGKTNPLVWIVGAEGDNLLHGFDAITGNAVFSGASQPPMVGLHHFQTLIAANKHFYVAADNRVYAFTAGQ